MQLGFLGDVNVHCIASSEGVVALQMLLRCRCCCVEDVATLKMLLRWRCWLLRWRCCYVEDVVVLKMLLRWRCCYGEGVVANTFKTALRMWRDHHVHFAHGSLGIYDILCQSKETRKWKKNIKKTRNSYGTYKNNIQWKTQSHDSFWNLHSADRLNPAWLRSQCDFGPTPISRRPQSLFSNRNGKQAAAILCHFCNLPLLDRADRNHPSVAIARNLLCW